MNKLFISHSNLDRGRKASKNQEYNMPIEFRRENNPALASSNQHILLKVNY